jgi:MFS family permease
VSTSGLLLAASVVFAAALAALVLVRQPVVVALLLVPAGAAWMTVLSSTNASMQLFLPRWVRARGLAVNQLAIFGSQAAGGVVWGLVAEQAGLVTAFLAAAVLMAAGAATMPVWPLLDTSGLSRDPASYWPEPRLAVDPDLATGPVLVTVTYVVAPDDQEAFVEAMQRVRRSRLRTGAVRWGLYREGETPDRFVEMYLVRSWGEHLRQHEGRLTGADQEFEQQARALSQASPQVAHLLPAEPA